MCIISASVSVAWELCEAEKDRHSFPPATDMKSVQRTLLREGHMEFVARNFEIVEQSILHLVVVSWSPSIP